MTEKGKPVADVAQRLGMSVLNSLYAWIKRYSKPQEQRKRPTYTTLNLNTIHMPLIH